MPILLFVKKMNRTTFSPRDMELTDGLPQSPIVATPPRTGIFRQRGDNPQTVRRNLMSSFDNADQTAMDGIATSTPLPDVSPEREIQSLNAYNKKRNEWSCFIVMWIIVFVFGCVGVYALYHYFPGYLLLCLTKELLISGSLGLFCVVLISIIVKLVFSGRAEPYFPQFDGPLNSRAVGENYPRGDVQSASFPSYGSPAVPTTSVTQGSSSTYQVSVKRTFNGDGKDTWTEYLRYFENIASINNWNEDRKLRIFFTMLRGQAESFAYGLSNEDRNSWQVLTNRMNERFGNVAMKESYIAEAKLRMKKSSETFRDFGQALEDLYRRAYPNNREFVAESSLKTFLDNCSETDDFRLAVRRTRPKSIQEAVTAAMQEDCIRVSEDRKYREQKLPKRPIYAMNQRGPFPNRQYSDNQRDKRMPEMRQNSDRRNGAKLKCFRCDSTEHVYRNCPSRKKFQERNNVSQKFPGRQSESETKNKQQASNSERPRQ